VNNSSRLCKPGNCSLFTVHMSYVILESEDAPGGSSSLTPKFPRSPSHRPVFHAIICG
jgi:hypothetical protein